MVLRDVRVLVTLATLQQHVRFFNPGAHNTSAVPNTTFVYTVCAPRSCGVLIASVVAGQSGLYRQWHWGSLCLLPACGCSVYMNAKMQLVAFMHVHAIAGLGVGHVVCALS